MDLLTVKNVSKSFGTKNVLSNINLNIGSGKIIGLLGKNGMGKSTLIKMITGLLTVDSGEILVNGNKTGVQTKKDVSYLPERICLNKDATVKQTFKFYSEFFSDFDRNKAEALLADLGLDINEKLSHMSKGMLEKIQLIVTMSRNAKLYILDEPLGGVDPATRDYILDTIISNACEGATVLISTHLIADIERILDEVIFINNGEIVLHEPTDTLRSRENASVDEIFRRTFRC
ncbi:MAG: ABC transporter ATP-binding protein [Clostridiales bacterium]|nr:ABC transporter ATP-binding protein [Candidatus Equinaster intestinalis]